MSQSDDQAKKPIKGQAEDPLDTIFTWPNLATLLRLLLLPIFFVILLDDSIPNNNTIACIIFAIAASTDWVDGQLARRTNSVSKFGQQFDPAVDRLLIALGVIGVYCVGRVPLWIVIVLILRDLVLLVGTALLRTRTKMKMIPVIFMGKVTTALLFIGFASLMINWPISGGLGLFECSWLPGFGSQQWALGIWFIYAAMVCSIIVMVIYLRRIRAVLKAEKLKDEE